MAQYTIILKDQPQSTIDAASEQAAYAHAYQTYGYNGTVRDVFVSGSKVEITTGGYTRFVTHAIAKRIRIETRIAKSAIAELLSAGYTLGVYDGEETTIKQSTDKQAVLDALQTTDDDYLLVYKAGESKRCGWVRFVYGNDGWDVISDYTVNLEDALTETNKLADTLSV